jgi:hypothetical protein
VEADMRGIGLVAHALGLAAVPGVRADTLHVAADAQTHQGAGNTGSRYLALHLWMKS